ncbi:Transcription initiation factor TFIID subunit 5 [Podochytrium sp. JEL0797]|nr:Transcription initiation factor TFIID subunit 5 [Podochytrium sp. JEL0797]
MQQRDFETEDRFVALYLRERGYNSAFAAFSAEAKPLPNQASSASSTEASIPDFLLLLEEQEANNPNPYEHSYQRLEKWVADSLEKYRPELSTVLFPLFTHAYLDLISRSLTTEAKHFLDSHRKGHLELHSAEVVRLASITTPEHVKVNELAVQFMSTRYTVRMTRYAFELLLAFLQDNKFMLLTRLLNRHVTIRVDNERLAGGGSSTAALQEGVGLVGLTPDQLDGHNSQPIKLGALPADPWMVQELEHCLSDYKFDKEEHRVELRALIKREETADENTPSRESVPQPLPKFTDVKKELDALKEIRLQMAKNASGSPAAATSAPNVCCYTFHNTYDTLTCISSSPDNTLVMAGFSDSILKVWSLKGDNLKTLTQNASKELTREPEGTPSKRLIGHSGPITACRISTSNRFALSTSTDATTRLWSLDTFTNLALYKGHNSPIWDLDLAANDVYFATAGFDRTSRIWRTDMINPVRMLVGHETDVEVVRFHPNCNYIATGASDGEVRLWSVQNGASVRILRGHIGAVMSLAFSADGKYLASGGEDKTVKVWDLGSGRMIKSLEGGHGVVGPGVGSPELVGRYYTKKTPVFDVKYTKSNVLLAFGPYLS